MRKKPSLAADGGIWGPLMVCFANHCRATDASKPSALSPQPTIRDPHHAAGMRPGKGSPIIIQKRELHGFWAAKNCVVGSSRQRNGSFEGISRRLEAKCFSWPCIEAEGDLIEVMLGVNG